MTTTDYMNEHLSFAAPLDTAKPHNYLRVDADGGEHLLDRYTEQPTTLCGKPAQLSEVEYDPMGYHGNVCANCHVVLVNRILA